jgi:uncharacterized membrane protein YkoI
MNTTTPTVLRRVALVGALPLVAALALTGCSANDDDAVGASATDSASASDSASTGASSGTASDAATTGASSGALAAAGRTALGAVGSGTVVSVEQEAGGSSWEVLVASDDGTEHEVHTDATGQDVTAGPTADDSDADDRAENTAFVDAARIDYRKAASVLVDTVAGDVTELGLDDHAGTVVWEGDVVDSAGTKHSIRIDAGTGDLVTNTVDSGD